ncbi:MAG: hypothetical protein KDK12_18300 [Rhodobacteraceae bacterium]|nr:hypothetical protein [Paracoccaceae bacterium]
MSKDNAPNAPETVVARRVSSVRGSKGDEAKEARVKAALKANIARRKAQAKARSGQEDEDE